MESLAVVKAGWSSELLLSISKESAAAVESESARLNESAAIAMLIESAVIRTEESVTISRSAALCLALRERLSSCEDTVKEHTSSNSNAAAAIFFVSDLVFPDLYCDINYLLISKISYFCKSQIYNYFQK